MLRQVGQSIYIRVGGKSKTFLDYQFIPVLSFFRYCTRSCLTMMAGVGVAHKLLKKQQQKKKKKKKKSDSELLLVIRPNDNHSPGPVIRAVSP